MLNIICQKTNDFISQMPKTQRKEYGQFFTSVETARFMASLFDLTDSKKSVSILDAGAGSGILAISIAERILHQDSSVKVEVVCYENDSHVLPVLKSNLELVKKEYKKFSYEVIEENYILSQRDSFNGNLFATETKKYDLIIGNPPYKKISKDAPEALAMPEVCHGAPNL